MTEAEAAPDAPAPAGSERPITFRGREIWVKLPSPEQYTVWRRTLKAIQGADTDSWNAEQALTAFERTRKIIDSVLVNRPDREWIDDEWLEGDLTLTDTAQIIQLTTEAFAKDESGNRADRRAVKAAPKKAARRKAPK